MVLRPEEVTQPSETALRWLTLVTAYVLIILFFIGIIDLFIAMYGVFVSGEFTDPEAVIELIDIVLLLLIIVEVHRTLIAIVRDEPVVRIIVSVAIIAVARQIISFRVDDFEAFADAILAAGSLVGLLVALVVAYFLIRYVELDQSSSKPE